MLGARGWGEKIRRRREEKEEKEEKEGSRTEERSAAHAWGATDVLLDWKRCTCQFNIAAAATLRSEKVGR